MANPEELRKEDQQLPKPKRNYPQSRVTQALYLLIALVFVAWLLSMLT
ncbi:MAG: hypothetical protein Q3976_04005 [Corynebacterium sp.]|nr:hypothetical protein [Corynebacterium sp.]